MSASWPRRGRDPRRRRHWDSSSRLILLDAVSTASQWTTDSTGGSSPLAPKISSKFCSFQAILRETLYFEQILGSRAPWPKSWICHWTEQHFEVLTKEIWKKTEWRHTICIPLLDHDPVSFLCPLRVLAGQKSLIHASTFCKFWNTNWGNNVDATVTQKCLTFLMLKTQQSKFCVQMNLDMETYTSTKECEPLFAFLDVFSPKAFLVYAPVWKPSFHKISGKGKSAVSLELCMFAHVPIWQIDVTSEIGSAKTTLVRWRHESPGQSSAFDLVGYNWRKSCSALLFGSKEKLNVFRGRWVHFLNKKRWAFIHFVAAKW